MNASELAALPMSGSAWDKLKAYADTPGPRPNISDQMNVANVYVLAKALVYARTGIEEYRWEVIDLCMAAIGTEVGGTTLSLGRNLVAFVIAADLVNLPADENQVFRYWLRRSLSLGLSGRTLQSAHEDRPNNWGTHAGASRAAVAAYLGDTAELDRTARVFQGWLGDSSVYAGFKYGDHLDNISPADSWHCDPDKPVGINPMGCTKSGYSTDGVLPDDQRRAGGFQWPPPQENYVWEALQGALVQAEILHRQGYDTYNWSDKALLRANLWLQDVASYPAEGDDTWQPHIVNYRYGTVFPAPIPSRHGKNIGFSDWTHGVGRALVNLTVQPPAPLVDSGSFERVEEKSSAIEYRGLWGLNTNSLHSAHKAARSYTAGSTAAFTFTGTAFRWIGYRDDRGGIAHIYVDGVLKGEIDTYSSTVKAQRTIYSIRDLPAGTHTVVIEVTGRKRDASRGYWVWMDAFDYK